MMKRHASKKQYFHFEVIVQFNLPFKDFYADTEDTIRFCIVALLVDNISYKD